LVFFAEEGSRVDRRPREKRRQNLCPRLGKHVGGNPIVLPPNLPLVFVELLRSFSQDREIDVHHYVRIKLSRWHPMLRPPNQTSDLPAKRRSELRRPCDLRGKRRAPFLIVVRVRVVNGVVKPQREFERIAIERSARNARQFSQARLDMSERVIGAPCLGISRS